MKWGATMLRHGHKFDHGLVEVRFRAKVRQPVQQAPKRDMKALDGDPIFETDIAAFSESQDTKFKFRILSKGKDPKSRRCQSQQLLVLPVVRVRRILSE